MPCFFSALFHNILYCSIDVYQVTPCQESFMFFSMIVHANTLKQSLVVFVETIMWHYLNFPQALRLLPRICTIARHTKSSYMKKWKCHISTDRPHIQWNCQRKHMQLGVVAYRQYWGEVPNIISCKSPTYKNVLIL